MNAMSRSLPGTLLLCAAIAVGAATCGACSGAAVDTARFAGTWRLTEIDSRRLVPMPADQVPFLVVSGNGVSGFDGCNTFDGRLDQPGKISSTRLGCPGGAVRLPLDLGNLLAHLQTGVMTENSLRVPAQGDFPASVFERSE